MILRKYQNQAINDVFSGLRNYPNEAHLAVIPPGGGKSLVIADMVRRVIAAKPDRRFLVATDVKELVGQNHAEFDALCPEITSGIYCAGLGRKEIKQSVIFGSVASLINFREEKSLFDIEDNPLFFHGLIIDEAHMVPPKGEGNYRTLIKRLKEINPEIKIIGLTATPYRAGSGLLTDDEGVFDRICHTTEMVPLIEQGFLSPLISKKPVSTPDVGSLHVRAGEFIRSEQTVLFSDSMIACREMVRLADRRKKGLIFCPSIEVAKDVTYNLQEIGINAVCVHSGLKGTQRDAIIDEFKEAIEQVFLVNVDILNKGFNVKNIDVLIIYRAIYSKGLYVQIVGRVTRIAEGKENGLVLDFGGNVERHGPIDDLGVKRLCCPKCGVYQALNNKNCVECDYEFPKICFQCKTENKQEAIRCTSCNKPFGKKECLNEKCKHLNPLKATNCVKCGSAFEVLKKENLDTTANELPILSYEPIEVTVKYEIYEPKGKPPMVRVNYFTLNSSFVASEYLCFSHQSRAAEIAKWWTKKLIGDDNVYYQIKNNKLSDSWTAIEFLRSYKRKPLKIKTSPQLDTRYKKVTIMEFTEASLDKEFRDSGNTVILKNEAMAEGEGKVLSIQSDHIVVNFGGRIENHPYRNGFIPGQNVTLHNGALLPCR